MVHNTDLTEQSHSFFSMQIVVSMLIMLFCL